MIGVRQHQPGNDIRDFVRVPHLLLQDDPKGASAQSADLRSSPTPSKPC
jgi:hypothetical protein